MNTSTPLKVTCVSESDRIKDFFDLYFEGKYGELTTILNSETAAMVPEQQLNFFKQIIKHSHSHKNPENWPEYEMAIRRIGMHPAFAPFVTSLPALYQQGIFFSNLPDLKTNVSVSFFDHPSMAKMEIDYTYYLFDQNGKQLCTGHKTIFPRETHTFNIADILKNRPQVLYGTFYLETSYRHLASFRIYASWYNENSMTTTHEKGCLRNSLSYLIYTPVFINENNEYHLVISNLSKNNLLLEANLFNSIQEQSHPQTLEIKISPKGTVMVPVSQYFQNSIEFLAGNPGYISVKPTPSGQAMYYYLLQNKRLNTWQIQHL